MNVYLDKNLIFRNLEFSNRSEALDFMASALLSQGCVKESYIEAIKNREEKYPTGLPSTSPRIAIPHANNELVNNTSIAVATLSRPIVFNNMEDNKDALNIEIIIMLAIAEPHGQIEMLQRIVGIIQDEEMRKGMLRAESNEDLFNIISKTLLY